MTFEELKAQVLNEIMTLTDEQCKWVIDEMEKNFNLSIRQRDENM